MWIDIWIDLITLFKTQEVLKNLNTTLDNYIHSMKSYYGNDEFPELNEMYIPHFYHIVEFIVYIHIEHWYFLHISMYLPYTLGRAGEL